MKIGRVDGDFRWRGGEVSRLEGFSDAVFGFALTLLVVWEKHYRFFRRYGLQDGTTVLLNSLLLFVVLFYVYPLKFVSTAFIEGMLFRRRSVVVDAEQIPALFTVYGAGYVAIFAIYGTLYL